MNDHELHELNRALGVYPSGGIETQQTEWEKKHPTLFWLRDELITILFLLAFLVLLRLG